MSTQNSGSQTVTVLGRIIRILDKETVVINLGTEDGIEPSTRFDILAEPEPIIDPQTKGELGQVRVVKGKLKPRSVFDRFTIAISRWTESHYTYSDLTIMRNVVPMATMESETVGSELNVKSGDIRPWKAQSVIPVVVGVKVSARISLPTEPSSPLTNTDETDAEK